MDMFHRRARRSSMPRAVIQSQKVVQNHAPQSIVGGNKVDYVMSTGVDSVAAGQLGPTTADVPTGSIIKFFEIQFSWANLENNTANFMFISVQHLLKSQGTIVPNVVGGDAQRNQVFYQMQRSLGENQNGNMVIKFRVPKKYQRVREQSSWTFTVQSSDNTVNAVQIIYKYYR